MVFSFIDILSLLLWEWEHSTVAVIPLISDALSDIMISIASRRIGGTATYHLENSSCFSGGVLLSSC